MGRKYIEYGYQPSINYVYSQANTKVTWQISSRMGEGENIKKLFFAKHEKDLSKYPYIIQHEFLDLKISVYGSTDLV